MRWEANDITAVTSESRNDVSVKELINFMEHGLSWEANSSSALQQILRILCKPRIHHREHKSSQQFTVFYTQ
jgi:hypothetical protein